MRDYISTKKKQLYTLAQCINNFAVILGKLYGFLYVHILRTQYTFTRYIDFTKIFIKVRDIYQTQNLQKKSTIGTFTSEKKTVFSMSFYYESLLIILRYCAYSVLNSFNKIIFITFAVAVISLSDYICISEREFFSTRFSWKFDKSSIF